MSCEGIQIRHPEGDLVESGEVRTALRRSQGTAEDQRNPVTASPGLNADWHVPVKRCETDIGANIDFKPFGTDCRRSLHIGLGAVGSARPERAGKHVLAPDNHGLVDGASTSWRRRAWVRKPLVGSLSLNCSTKTGVMTEEFRILPGFPCQGEYALVRSAGPCLHITGLTAWRKMNSVAGMNRTKNSHFRNWQLANDHWLTLVAGEPEAPPACLDENGLSRSILRWSTTASLALDLSLR